MGKIRLYEHTVTHEADSTGRGTLDGIVVPLVGDEITYFRGNNRTIDANRHLSIVADLQEQCLLAITEAPAVCRETCGVSPELDGEFIECSRYIGKSNP